MSSIEKRRLDELTRMQEDGEIVDFKHRPEYQLMSSRMDIFDVPIPSCGASVDFFHPLFSYIKHRRFVVELDHPPRNKLDDLKLRWFKTQYMGCVDVVILEKE